METVGQAVERGLDWMRRVEVMVLSRPPGAPPPTRVFVSRWDCPLLPTPNRLSFAWGSLAVHVMNTLPRGHVRWRFSDFTIAELRQ